MTYQEQRQKLMGLLIDLPCIEPVSSLLRALVEDDEGIRKDHLAMALDALELPGLDYARMGRICSYIISWEASSKGYMWWSSESMRCKLKGKILFSVGHEITNELGLPL
jgi:hypothetical protein